MPGRLNESNKVASSTTSGHHLTNQNLKKAKGNNEAKKYKGKKNEAKTNKTRKSYSRKQDCSPSNDIETNSGMEEDKGKEANCPGDGRKNDPWIEQKCKRNIKNRTKSIVIKSIELSNRFTMLPNFEVEFREEIQKSVKNHKKKSQYKYKIRCRKIDKSVSKMKLKQNPLIENKIKTKKILSTIFLCLKLGMKMILKLL